MKRMSCTANQMPPFDPDCWKRHALLTCEEMRHAEALAVGRGSQSFYDLMQVAGRSVAQAAIDRFAPGRVLVMCGAGNNGGDGYVAAEALRSAGWVVKVGVLAPPATVDTQRAASAWGGESYPLGPSLLKEADLIVDALFGTGLTRPLEGVAAEMAMAVREAGIPVICADFPSGINGNTGGALGAAFQATITVTFFRKKRGHVLLPGRLHCGEILVADTGMAPEVLDEMVFLTSENHEDLWRDLEPVPRAQNHKYDRGHALIFGGAIMTGAARLAARAAQRMGAGLVTLAAPKEAWEIYAKTLESVIVPPVDGLADCQKLLDDPKRGPILIGPGLGLEPEKKALLLAALETGKPCVLDADALTLLAEQPDQLLQALHEDCILTPHEGEFIRLFGARIDSGADKVTRAQQAAAMAGCVVLLKGADTVVARPDGYAVVNTNAPPWLATGGAGDVLAGMILGLLAAGMPIFAAGCMAAYRHGQIAQNHGPGLIAEDIVNGIIDVLQK